MSQVANTTKNFLIVGLVIAIAVASVFGTLYFNTVANPIIRYQENTVFQSTTATQFQTVQQPPQIITMNQYTTVSEATTQVISIAQPNADLNPLNSACLYPMNPQWCNEGPPITIYGTISNSSSSSCIFLSVGNGDTYVLANTPGQNYNGTMNNLPIGITNGESVQVYGYIYPDWSRVMGANVNPQYPQGIPFPPYPFERTLCIGIPMWTMYPYVQQY